MCLPFYVSLFKTFFPTVKPNTTAKTGPPTGKAAFTAAEMPVVIGANIAA